MVPLRTTLGLVLIFVCMLLAVGCTGLGLSGEKAAIKNLIQTFPSRIPTPTFRVGESTGSNVKLVVENITSMLIFWNEKMSWNLSSEQIDDYANNMENGVLKKYRTTPNYPHLLQIPDDNLFYREVGLALGFTIAESEDFARAINQYHLEYWQMTDCRDYVNNKPCEQCTITINFSVKPRPMVTAQ